MAGTFDPELQLLLACSRARIGAERRERIGELIRAEGGIKWPRLIEAARRHAVVPLVHRALAGEQGAPVTARAQLHGEFLRGTAANLLLAGELRAVLAELAGEGIDVFVHKGLGIAAQAYGDLSLRHTGDLDLFLRFADVTRARDALALRLGYTGAREPATDHYHLTLRHPSTGVKVELHWAFTRDRWPFVIPGELLWPHVMPVPSQAGPLPCLDPAVNVLALCAHGAKETWSRYGLVVDLAELIDRYPELDWEWTLAQSVALDRLEPVLTGLALAQSLAGASLPDAPAIRVRNCPTAIELAGRIGAHPIGDPQPDDLRDAVRSPLKPAPGYYLRQPFRRLRKLLLPGEPQ